MVILATLYRNLLRLEPSVHYLRVSHISMRWWWCMWSAEEARARACNDRLNSVIQDSSEQRQRRSVNSIQRRSGRRPSITVTISNGSLSRFDKRPLSENAPSLPWIIRERDVCCVESSFRWWNRVHIVSKPPGTQYKFGRDHTGSSTYHTIVWNTKLLGRKIWPLAAVY